MNKPTLHDALEAFAEASWIGEHGTPDQQAGRFATVLKANPVPSLPTYRIFLTYSAYRSAWDVSIPGMREWHCAGRTVEEAMDTISADAPHVRLEDFLRDRASLEGLTRETEHAREALPGDHLVIVLQSGRTAAAAPAHTFRG